MLYNFIFLIFIILLNLLNIYIYCNLNISNLYKKYVQNYENLKLYSFSIKYLKFNRAISFLYKEKENRDTILKKLCKLRGILYPNFAIFICKNNIKILSRGDKLYNCTLKSIGQSYVIFHCLNVEQKFVLNLKEKKIVKKEKESFSKIKKSNALVFKLNHKNTNIFSVRRQHVLNLISSGKIFYQMAVVPYYRNGRVIGFRVTGVKPNSFVYKMGIRRGDIILSVNGYPIRSMEEGFSAFERLKYASEVNIKVLRGGKEITLSYIIQN